MIVGLETFVSRITPCDMLSTQNDNPQICCAPAGASVFSRKCVQLLDLVRAYC